MFFSREKLINITMNETFTMKELPLAEKPYEKCMTYGAAALSDAELLSVIIRTGTRGVSALNLSKNILTATCGKTGLLGLHRLSTVELTKIKGVGRVKAIQIKCITELSRRLAKQKAEMDLHFHEPSTIAAYYMEDLRHRDQEQIHLMMLNTKNRLLGEKIVSKGTANASMISPREIFLQALHYHAVTIVLIHNHPSGDPTPSNADIDLTKRMQEAGKLLGIELLDHVIIGNRKYMSFRESGILN